MKNYGCKKLQKSQEILARVLFLAEFQLAVCNFFWKGTLCGKFPEIFSEEWENSTEQLWAVSSESLIPASIYLFNVNNANIRTMCEICSKLTIKLPQRRQCRSYVFNIYFEQISHCSNAFIVDSEQVNAVWN